MPTVGRRIGRPSRLVACNRGWRERSEEEDRGGVKVPVREQISGTGGKGVGMNRREFLTIAGGGLVAASLGAGLNRASVGRAPESEAARPLDLGWAKRRWSDPLTGTEVVCLSPEEELHFRNPYFRIPMFTRDGKYAVLWAYPEPATGESGLWCIDLRSGQTRVYHYGRERRIASLSSWATSYGSHLMHVLVRTERGVEIEQVDLDFGDRRTITPATPLSSVYDATASAGDEFIYTPISHREVPPGVGLSEWVALLGSDPGLNEMYRVDLETGAVELLFDTERWWLGHPNPNPRRRDILMFCQEGFIWTERHPRPPDFERVRLYDLQRKEFVTFPGLQWRSPAHEIWSADGERIWTHGWPAGHHCVSVTEVRARRTTTYVHANWAGRTAHIHPAPNERFVVGDGQPFGLNNQADIEEVVKAGDVDDPWAFGGYGSASPGEVIWKYELPAESFFRDEHCHLSYDELARLIEENPGGAARAVPLCQYRSRVRLLRSAAREESNAHVTPDSRWAVFQSASEEGLYEVWAARVPGVK